MRVLAVAMVLVMLSISSCANEVGDIVVTAEDSGLELAVSSGGRVEVQLESNPSTGYSWQVDSRPVDSFATVSPSDFNTVTFNTVADDQLVGAAGVEVFTIDVTGRGAGVLRFEYIRPFDDPPVAARIVEFILRSDGAPWPPDDADLGAASATRSQGG